MARAFAAHSVPFCLSKYLVVPVRWPHGWPHAIRNRGERRMTMQRHYRQGDVLIRRVQRIPADAKPIARDNGRVVPAYGEGTGHAHASLDRDAVPLSATEERTFLRLASESTLVHEAHATITLPPGSYEVVRHREYT